MRKIKVSEVTKIVKRLCMESNYYYDKNILIAMKNKVETEKSPIGVNILKQVVKNAEIAKEKQMPICQDTGMAIIFVRIGQEVIFEEGLLEEAIQEGVRQGYKEGNLRKSIVGDPIYRENTGDNTPAIIYYDIVAGDKVEIDVAPKGFGSENMSQIHMLKPSDGIEGIKKVILDTVDRAGGNACPPMIVGVGIGGNFEYSALLAKKALLRDINKRSSINHIKELELELLNKINKLGIGPQGLGGNTTAIAINIEIFPTHIAGLPVAINIGCHVTRHRKAIL